MLNIEYVLGSRRTSGDCPVEWSGIGCMGRFPRIELAMLIFPLTRFPRNMILGDLVALWRDCRSMEPRERM